MGKTYKARLAAFNRAVAGNYARLEQKIAIALGGFPWYCDSPEWFPGATKKDGVCVGELVLEDLVTMAVERIKELERQLEQIKKAA